MGLEKSHFIERSSEGSTKNIQSEFKKFVSTWELSDEQIYNVDESGLFWECLLISTIVFESEGQAGGHKSSKERITIMSCIPQPGVISLDCVIVKSKKPWLFKDTKAKKLPVDYSNQKKQ